MVPEDQYLVLDETIYQTYTSLTDRYFDGHSFYNCFNELGYNWIAQPSPQLTDLDPTTKWWNGGKEIYQKILSNKVLGHTATMYKAGDKLITNTQGPGTQKGLEWCKRNIKDVEIVANDSTVMNGVGDTLIRDSFLLMMKLLFVQTNPGTKLLTRQTTY